MLRIVFFYVLFFPWTALVILCGAPFSLLRADYMHNSGRLWARVTLWLAGVRLQVSGHEHLPVNGQPVIFAGNHQSNFDILCYFAGLPLQFRWMAKEELFQVPLFGFAMRRSGYIAIDRSNGRKAMKGITLAAERIQSGTSVVIFPEGTRSYDGKLQEFKKGGFLIALKARVPIVPVAISGSWQVMHKGEFKFRPGIIRLQILAPIETASLTIRDSERLLDQVSSVLTEAIEKESHFANIN
ncbi:lysophospholipid acyltransferase family protein [Geopsychrobacter electrodiphilus]|uniref:lysophospholipid acyltransferase family protein n=1 Tax=Geopsychrobacter electrodiphilus TaxID=225196 RepID=UPI000379B03D|nr:lysophospholipid acyltransferase family protein [Geopsychrobacter electrodiphilus]